MYNFVVNRNRSVEQTEVPQESDLSQTAVHNLADIRSHKESPIDLDRLKSKHSDKPLGRRVAPRYSVHFEVVLMSSKKSFRTKTLNISEVGALLVDLVPSEFSRELFEVLFTTIDDSGKKEYFLFHARTAEGRLRSPRIQFIKSMGDSANRLNDLIEKLTPLEV